MNPYAVAAPAVLMAYLIGGIPFGFMTARWVKGIDIRTVGSGNIGATNVGRVLGFRFFVLVFLLDMLKGFLPTSGFPRALAEAGWHPPPELGVLVALATILGHNFPIYLGFRGGKGVATSLGAVLALDMVAALASASGFVICLLVTRYVSVSSLGGGLVFLIVSFGRVKEPWSRDHFAMSALIIGLMILLFVRHRKNLARIAAGTEPKVSLWKKATPRGEEKKTAPRSGRIAWVLVVVLVVASLGVARGLAVQAARRSQVTVGRYTLTEVARVGTEHQRAERLTFADRGRRLAVTCPRYERVVLYRVTESEGLDLVRDIELEGRPVAVWATADRLFVLERPAGDARHVEPGWWEAFDFQGDPVGSKVRVGMYPDDLAVTPDRLHALVLTSGRAEGGGHRPAPALDVVALGSKSGSEPPRVVGHVTFEGPGDDPARLTLSATGRRVVVTLLGSNQIAAIDLANPAHPQIIGRAPLPESEVSDPPEAPDDRIVMPVASGREAVWITWPGPPDATDGCLARTLPRDSGLAFHDPSTHRSLGRLTLRSGAMNLSATRPTGLAFNPDRGLLAVANRSGGVHLIAMRSATARHHE